MCSAGRAARASDLFRARCDEKPRSGVLYFVIKEGDIVEFKFNV